MPTQEILYLAFMAALFVANVSLMHHNLGPNGNRWSAAASVIGAFAACVGFTSVLTGGLS